MGKGRLEAFSDGVLAIIITIMVLELKIPHGVGLNALKPLLFVFLSYVLSFVNVAIYWNNHHHLMQTIKHVNGRVLWANTHLLFWLSLIPFGTGWMGENHFSLWPVVLYGVILVMAGISYTILSTLLIRLEGRNSALAIAVGKDWKGRASIVIYLGGIALSFISPWLGFVLYVIVACMWFIPDQRIEKNLEPGNK